ncbi:DNA primase/helicase [Bacteriophage DSS3_PM1]|nr:DNA primase/helicase [Bacteriophage DSS3_PM1]
MPSKIVLPKQPCPVHGGSDSVAVYDDGSAHCFNGECNHHWRPGSYDFDTDTFIDPKKRKHDDGLSDDDEDDDVDMSQFIEEDEDEAPRRKTTTKRTTARRGKAVEPNPQEVVNKIFDGYEADKYKYRGVSEAVVDFYRCRISYNNDGTQKAIYYAYNLDENLHPQGYKKRILPKDFSEGAVGKVSGTFGRGLFSGGKRLILTEGEDDTFVIQEAYYRKYGRMYPVQSLRSSTGVKDLVEEREEMRKFKEIILWLDNDSAGEKALKEAAKILGYDKVKVVKCGYKDAGDVAREEGIERVLGYIYDATEYSPAAILNGKDLWERVVNYNKKPSISYPAFMAGLNEKLGGMRFGEITLWTSGTGSGKSTLMREIMYHLSQIAKLITAGEEFFETENYKKLIELCPSMENYEWEQTPRIGVVTLEESPEETARKLAGMAINRNPAAEEIDIDDLKPGFDDVFGDGNVLVLDHQGSIDDGSIMDHLEYMCLKGCKWIFVDHITILVSEGMDGLSGNEAIDKIMNDLLKLVKKYDVWIGLISHLRKTPNDKVSFEEGKIPSLDDIKGSGSIKQIAFDVIGFARNQASNDEDERNTVNTKVLKCRYTGKTGPSGAFLYDFMTGRMQKGDDSFMTEKGAFEVV